MIGQCCNFHGINSTVEISWDIFWILVDYRLRHLVNNVAIHIYIHNYIRMEITVLYLKISLHQLSISWSQMFVYWFRLRVASKLNLRPSYLQLMPWNFQMLIKLENSFSWVKITFSRKNTQSRGLNSRVICPWRYDHTNV